MSSPHEISRSLTKDITHAAGITGTAIATFSRASTATTEAVAGGLGAFVGLASATAVGIAYPLYASIALDVCGFGGFGCLSLLLARFMTSKGKRAQENDRRVELAFRTSEIELRMQTLERLPGWISPKTRDAFAQDLLVSLTPSAEVALPNSQLRLP